MILTDVRVDAVVSDAVLRWSYLAESEDDLTHLRRLTSSNEARDAWRKVARLEGRVGSKGGFWWVANCIGRFAVSANLSESDLRTQDEIRKAGTRAAQLARELLQLMENNSSLDFMGIQLLPIPHKAALDRLQRGIIQEANRTKGRGDAWFDPEVEAELDRLQARDYPEVNGLTTSVAYRLINWEEMVSMGGFKARLTKFIELAEQSSGFDPIVPKPKKASAREHALALSCCHCLNSEFGSPCHDIVAGLVSAVFETVVDAETVKKWWQRDISRDE